METIVQCPCCGSINTTKTANGKFSDKLAKVGAIVGGALLDVATGIPGILGANLGYRHTWHQYYCRNCHEAFKVRLGVGGEVLETKR